MADANAVIVDDSDGSILYEGGSWFDIGVSGNPGVKNGTLSETTAPGSFSMIFIGEQRVPLTHSIFPA